jgi:ADP-heptose:LPS heptosyltransferase
MENSLGVKQIHMFKLTLRQKIVYFCAMKKVLIIRFSSIGDIVLTSPIIRCIKQQMDCELNFLTKPQFSKVVDSNPYIDKIIYLDKNISNTIAFVKNQDYDYIIDLHNNLRSRRITLMSKAKIFRFDKINIKKWLIVRLKINFLHPNMHIVDRYFDSIRSLGIQYDKQGLDYYISNQDKVNVSNDIGFEAETYTALVLGATYFTKRIPISKWIEIIEISDKNFVLLGAKEEGEVAQLLNERFGNRIQNMCGKLNLNQSASVVRQAKYVITGDTGLMHIAAAFRKPIVSVWGNTIPAFGMYPFFPDDYKEKSIIVEVYGLGCRPCSKLGFNACPQEHFNCMQKIETKKIVDFLQK